MTNGKDTGNNDTFHSVGPVYSIHIQAETSSFIKEPRMELDGRANTSVVGNHFLVVHYFNRPFQVSGYDTMKVSR